MKPFVCDILLGFNYKLGLFHSIEANIFEKSIQNQKELHQIIIRKNSKHH